MFGNNLKQLLKYNTDCNLLANIHKVLFSGVIQFYGNLKDLLGKLVSLCTEPPKSQEIKKKT